ncbi:NfeD-like C-terminal, partner-binding [Desulfonatronum thiosulfatophilum]|uniref:NfeD-like C-terminal, partner-binding n=1 Tax=Desulfonatronum thiosulfatophilum TaxID=617002 RepID=A0A1G6ET74_9BACT|nr:NfeD family protein [Desulfonatronum thiosulfatophilum]SDB60005.1 NfeD-like C-terminal, partner-binding [Desulfonatronum thiosulfatophilum]
MANNLSKQNQPTWDRTTVLRYALMQIPGVALVGAGLWFLHSVLGLSERSAWMLMLLWLAKDTLMFFFVWPAYQANVGDGWYSLVGLRGEVRGEMHPEGYIRIGGVLWKAKADPKTCPIPPGTVIEVVGREGIKLIVRPLPPPNPEQDI